MNKTTIVARRSKLTLMPSKVIMTDIQRTQHTEREYVRDNHYQAVAHTRSADNYSQYVCMIVNIHFQALDSILPAYQLRAIPR